MHMISPAVIDSVRGKYEALKSELDEKSRRLWAATEADALGHGGVRAVSKATGIAESTIRNGQREIRVRAIDRLVPKPERVRKQGAGRRRLTEKDRELLDLLDALLEPVSRGDPLPPLRWTCKSTRQLAKELSLKGRQISHAKVGQLLVGLDYTLQGTRKRMEGTAHPDRDAQFRFINDKAMDFLRRHQPVISLIAQKKELRGRFSDKENGDAIRRGVCDVATNESWVNVDPDADTTQFAAQAVHQWWRYMGRRIYPQARELLVAADGGGGINGLQSRLWKREVQHLVDELHIDIAVCHFPTGTSKWRNTEHRLLSHIAKDTRGQPLIAHEVIVDLIADPPRKGGGHVHSGSNTAAPPADIRVSNSEMKALKLEKNDFHGEWNYTLRTIQNR